MSLITKKAQWRASHHDVGCWCNLLPSHNDTASGCRDAHAKCLKQPCRFIKWLLNRLCFRQHRGHIPDLMQIHASCAAREGYGVLLLGPPGAGKSDLALRLLDCGFVLVADDRVDIDDGYARAPPALAGLIEVRGIGLLEIPYAAHARLALAVDLKRGERLPLRLMHKTFDIPVVSIDPAACSAARRVGLALDCALGLITQRAGPFA